jgi:hypothetical protein
MAEMFEPTSWHSAFAAQRFSITRLWTARPK